VLAQQCLPMVATLLLLTVLGCGVLSKGLFTDGIEGCCPTPVGCQPAACTSRAGELSAEELEQLMTIVANPVSTRSLIGS